MTCDAPAARWGQGLLSGAAPVLCVVGLAGTVASVLVKDGLAGGLQVVSGLFFFLGTGGAVGRGHGLGGVLGVAGGAGSRRTAMEKACQAHRGRALALAELICGRSEDAARAVEVAFEHVAEQWLPPPEGREFRLFVLCHTLDAARTTARVAVVAAETGPLETGNRQLALVGQLHDVCGCTVAEVAGRLDQDPAQVTASLAAFRGRP